MKITTIVRSGRRAATVGLLVAALASGSTLAVAAPPAQPGVPDVGAPRKNGTSQSEPAADPAEVTSRAAPRGWTEVISVADGARIRTRPVVGAIVGLIPFGAYFWISCQVRAADSFIWGYANHAGRLGWVRDDLWDVVRYTAPGAPAPRPIPWC